LECNLQLANASWCQRDRWHHLLHVTAWRISLLCGRDTVNDVTKVGHAQNIYYQRIVSQCLIHTLTLRRNLISLAIFNAIFLKNWWWLTLYNINIQQMVLRQIDDYHVCMHLSMAANMLFMLQGSIFIFITVNSHMHVLWL